MLFIGLVWAGAAGQGLSCNTNNECGADLLLSNQGGTSALVCDIDGVTSETSLNPDDFTLDIGSRETICKARGEIDNVAADCCFQMTWFFREFDQYTIVEAPRCFKNSADATDFFNTPDLRPGGLSYGLAGDWFPNCNSNTPVRKTWDDVRNIMYSHKLFGVNCTCIDEVDEQLCDPHLSEEPPLIAHPNFFEDATECLGLVASPWTLQELDGDGIDETPVGANYEESTSKEFMCKPATAENECCATVFVDDNMIIPGVGPNNTDVLVPLSRNLIAGPTCFKITPNVVPYRSTLSCNDAALGTGNPVSVVDTLIVPGALLRNTFHTMVDCSAAGLIADGNCTVTDCQTPLIHSNKCIPITNSILCPNSLFFRALPTQLQWGCKNPTEINGTIRINQNDQLRAIPDDGFDKCPYTEATRLDLSFNGITTVGARAFSRLSALTHLLLNDNAITFMAADALAGITGLQTLNLADNAIAKFDFGAMLQFRDTIATLFLVLQTNQLTQAALDPGCNGTGSTTMFFSNTLILAAAETDCPLNPCPSDAMACPKEGQCEKKGYPTYMIKCVDLKRLPIEYQWLNWEPGDATMNLAEALVNRIELSDEITILPEGGFDSCPYTEVKNLYLTNNMITFVGTRAFLPSLELIHLNNNDITFIDIDAFFGLTQLKELHLRNNEIGRFYYGALNPFGALMTTLMLGDNDFDNFDCTNNGEKDMTGSLNIMNAIETDCPLNPCPPEALACPAQGGTSCESVADPNEIVDFWMECEGGYTEVPTAEKQWGRHNVSANPVGDLYLKGNTPNCANDCTNNNIAIIRDNAFDACPYTESRALFLQYNEITRIGRQAFATLANLEILNLQGNPITYIAETALDGLTKLTELSLGTGFLAFDYSALSLLVNPDNLAEGPLAQLYLSDENFPGTYVEPTKCNNRTDWVSQVLITNAVVHCGQHGSPCPDGAVACLMEGIPCTTQFAGANQLNSIECVGGYVRTPNWIQWGLNEPESSQIDPTTITGSLVLRDQQITSLPFDAFADCPFVEATLLNLQNNVITVVESQAFQSLTALTTLRLNGNRITDISPEAFEGLVSLEYLDLSENSVIEFFYESIFPLTNLTLLDLRENRGCDITCQGSDFFNTQTQISNAVEACAITLPGDICRREESTVDGFTAGIVCEGGYTTVPIGIQWGQHNVEDIDHFITIANQNLTVLEKNAFQDCPYTSANTLYLQGNKITLIQDNAFSTFTNLQTLHLGDNQLSVMSTSSLQGLNLNTLFLSGNNIVGFHYEKLRTMTNLMVFDLHNQELNVVETLYHCGNSVTFPVFENSVLQFAFFVLNNNGCFDFENPCHNDLTACDCGQSTLANNECGYYCIDCDSCEGKSKIVVSPGTAVADEAFKDCEPLEEVFIPNEITSIGDSAFKNCTNLETFLIEIPGGNNGLESMGIQAMAYSSKLTKLVFPPTLKSLGGSVCLGCYSLELVRFPQPIADYQSGSNDLSIGSFPFPNCYESNPDSDSKMFGLVVTPEFSSNEPNFATERTCLPCTEVLTIPDHVIDINPFAYYGCSIVETLVVPSSVTRIGFFAFGETVNLRNADIVMNATHCDSVANTVASCIHASSFLRAACDDPGNPAIRLEKYAYGTFLCNCEINQCRDCEASASEIGDPDGDGIANCVDACPIHPNKAEPGVCGCAIQDTDTDGDGVPDCVDGCPNTPDKTEPLQCGCFHTEPQGNVAAVGDCLSPNECPPTHPILGLEGEQTDGETETFTQCFDALNNETLVPETEEEMTSREVLCSPMHVASGHTCCVFATPGDGGIFCAAQPGDDSNTQFCQSGSVEIFTPTSGGFIYSVDCLKGNCPDPFSSIVKTDSSVCETTGTDQILGPTSDDEVNAEFICQVSTAQHTCCLAAYTAEATSDTGTGSIRCYESAAQFPDGINVDCANRGLDLSQPICPDNRVAITVYAAVLCDGDQPLDDDDEAAGTGCPDAFGVRITEESGDQACCKSECGQNCFSGDPCRMATTDAQCCGTSTDHTSCGGDDCSVCADKTEDDCPRSYTWCPTADDTVGTDDSDAPAELSASLIATIAVGATAGVALVGYITVTAWKAVAGASAGASAAAQEPGETTRMLGIKRL